MNSRNDKNQRRIKSDAVSCASLIHRRGAENAEGTQSACRNVLFSFFFSAKSPRPPRLCGELSITFLAPSINFFLVLCLFLIVCSNPARANAQTPVPTAKAQPIYDQCASLAKDQANGSSANDEVAKAIAALKEKDPNARAQAAARLGKSCDARAVEPLIDLLKDEDLMARIAAVEALGKLGDNNAVEPLIELVLSDKDWRVRMALISSLASFKTFHARNSVLNGIANPSDVDVSDVNDMLVRCAAILTCNQLRNVQFSRKAILFLYNFLNSKHAPIRQMAEQTLHELKNTRNASAEFRAILKNDRNPELRRWAAQWMGKIGFENAGEALAEASANDPDHRVKRAAADALAALKNER
ncbi:MAG: HEAT repeat domain-containing protein [Blastocatellales bacterium]